jgi:hypothetical protein
MCYLSFYWLVQRLLVLVSVIVTITFGLKMSQKIQSIFTGKDETDEISNRLFLILIQQPNLKIHTNNKFFIVSIIF